MQDRYVGDVGDFGKFGLLRVLTKGSNGAFQLGVVWCQYPDENHNGDGRHLAYLDRPDFSNLEPRLHAALAKLVRSGQRSMAAIETSNILPFGTSFFRDPTVDKSRGRQSSADRSAYRDAWRARALAATETADVVFFDPDNGLETTSFPVGHPKAGKYIFWDDLLPFWRRGQSLVVYHHLNRRAAAAVQTAALRARFHQKLASIAFLAPLLFRRGSCRHFWIVGQGRHSPRLEQLISQFQANGWSCHFDSEWRPLSNSVK